MSQPRLRKPKSREAEVLCEQFGIGPWLADQLIGAGLRTPADVAGAADAHLLKIPGLSFKRLAQIRREAKRRERIEHFDLRANHMGVWSGAAGALLEVCGWLDGEVDFLKPPHRDMATATAEEQQAHGEYLSRQVGLYSVHQMLRGMAVEAMLKSLWVKAGKVLAKDGRFIGINGHKRHDLRVMAAAVLPLYAIELTAHEWELLDTWRRYITRGRYPIPTSVDAEQLGLADAWGTQRDDEALRLLRKLRALLAGA